MNQTYRIMDYFKLIFWNIKAPYQKGTTSTAIFCWPPNRFSVSGSQRTSVWIWKFAYYNLYSQVTLCNIYCRCWFGRQTSVLFPTIPSLDQPAKPKTGLKE